jgi:hypothetical protein
MATNPSLWGSGRGAINPHKQTSTPLAGTTALQVQLKYIVGFNAPTEQWRQGPEVLRLQPCPESLLVNRPLGSGIATPSAGWLYLADSHRRGSFEQILVRQPCHSTFLVAYEGLSHLPSRSPYGCHLGLFKTLAREDDPRYLGVKFLLRSRGPAANAPAKG